MESSWAAESQGIARERTMRFKHSALLNRKLNQPHQPYVKRADEREEIDDAHSLVYREYSRLGYIKEENQDKKYTSIYNTLDKTTTFVCKSGETVIGTLTEIFDDENLGLPMDSLYRDELQPLRDSNRNIVELSALASSREGRRMNAFMYLFRSVFWNAVSCKVDDFCIMVNPNHVEFYKAILLFEDLGPEKHYQLVGAPAVALRLRLEGSLDKARELYNEFEIDHNWYSFLCSGNDSGMTDCCKQHEELSQEERLHRSAA